jgi:phosphate transport system permease protein
MSRRHVRTWTDTAAKYLVLVVGSAILILTFIYFYKLTNGSTKTFRFGLGFLFGSDWDPVNNVYGVAPEVYGSIVTSAIALIIGVPVSVGVAVFLSELSPRRLRAPVSFLVEMLAAVPSVVYGLWGLFILAPVLSTTVYPVLQEYLGFLPIFQGHIYNVSILTAGIVLAVMIIPIVSAISRDALRAVPESQREAAYALGATKSEAIRMSVLSYGRSGIIAAVFLGFGRAFGETMAVTMLIGNTPLVPTSFFSPGYSLASLIAQEYNDAQTPIAASALVEAGLVLFIGSFVASFLGRLLIRRLIKSREAASYL